MSWHLSKSNPCKIYDSRHEVAAMATSPEYAARIVAAVTGKPQEVIRLREPANQAIGSFRQTDRDACVIDGCEASISSNDLQSQTSSFSPTNEGQKSAVNSFEPDDCCGKHINKASRSGVLNSLMVWTCPRCETDWKPTTIGNIRHWKPEVVIAVLRR